MTKYLIQILATETHQKILILLFQTLKFQKVAYFSGFVVFDLGLYDLFLLFLTQQLCGSAANMGNGKADRAKG